MGGTYVWGRACREWAGMRLLDRTCMWGACAPCIQGRECCQVAHPRQRAQKAEDSLRFNASKFGPGVLSKTSLCAAACCWGAGEAFLGAPHDVHASEEHFSVLLPQHASCSKGPPACPTHAAPCPEIIKAEAACLDDHSSGNPYCYAHPLFACTKLGRAHMHLHYQWHVSRPAAGEPALMLTCWWEGCKTCVCIMWMLLRFTGGRCTLKRVCATKSSAWRWHPTT